MVGVPLSWVAMSDMAVEEPPPTLATLPDALVQHILSFLELELPALGSGLAASSALCIQTAPHFVA